MMIIVVMMSMLRLVQIILPEPLPTKAFCLSHKSYFRGLMNSYGLLSLDNKGWCATPQWGATQLGCSFSFYTWTLH